MNIQPLKTVEDSWNDTLTENSEATFFDIVNSDRDQAYTSLEEGIEGMKKKGIQTVEHDYITCYECGSYEDCDCEGYNQALTDILENVVKPLYGKE